MTHAEAVLAAQTSLAPDAGEHDVILEALRLLGIDAEQEQDGRRIADYVGSAAIIDGPETFLRWHVLRASETPDGFARFHF